MEKTTFLIYLITLSIVGFFLILNSFSVSKDETLPVGLSLKTPPGDTTTQSTGFVPSGLSSRPINKYSIAPEYS